MRANGSSFVGDVTKLLSAHVFCRALGWLVYPLVMTLYAAEDFGTLATFLALTGIPGALSCLSYQLAIMLPERDDDAANVLAVSMAIALAVAVLMAIVLGVAGEAICVRAKARSLLPYLWLAPLVTLMIGANLALTFWVTRGRAFTLLAAARSVHATSIRGVQLGAVLVGWGHVGGLVAAYVVGDAAMLLVLGIPVWAKDRALLRASISPRQMLTQLKRYRKFPLVHAWGILLNSSSSHLPAVILNTFFSPTIGGYFHHVSRLVSQPISLLGSAVARVSFQRASALRAQSQGLKVLVEEVYRRLAAFSIVPTFILALGAADACAVFLDPTLSELGRYVAIMSPVLLFGFLASPSGRLFIVFERQGALLLLQALLVAGRLGGLSLGGVMGSPVAAIMLYSIAAALALLVMLLWSFRLASVSPWRCLTLSTRYLVHLLVVAAILVPLRLFVPATPHVMLTVSAIVLAAYLAMIVARDRVLARFLR